MTDQKDWSAFALLLIDVQQDFWPEGSAAAFPDFPSNVERLLTFCRTSGLDIVHIRALFEPDQSNWMAKYIVKGSIPCVRGTTGAEILPYAQDLPGEKIMIKHTFDAFHNPEVLSYLRARNKTFILTAGLVTSVCVFLTTASAAQNGFLTAIVEDCCADEGDQHEQTLKHYPFIFERTAVDQLNTNYSQWMTKVEKVRNHRRIP